MPPEAPPKAFRIEPYRYAEARALASALELSEPVAIALVRRGLRSVEEARAFLDAADSHDPFEFDSMEEVVGLLLATIATRSRITVYGDYDVDGVCSTAILVRAVRDLGGECDWYIPDRLGDGYGLSAEGVRELAARGTELLLTADCGITALSEVALARDLGMDVVVTDHHFPDDALPDCPILHPRISGYPCEDLCATGVAHKLASALRERGQARAGDEQSDLDLVALATVADLVPLRGENRALVRAGLVEARRARRRGLRALIAATGVDPARLDEGDLAFRLAPRINAAGRLYRADAGVELMLATDDARAAQIAAELDRANHERRAAELQVLGDAERALADLGGVEGMPAIVLCGEGWHRGVIGIVASRLVERHWRPVILIGLDREGRGRGSGRSIPGLDLLAALRACEKHLIGFGGHRAAAGLEIAADRVAGFREALGEQVASMLGPDDLVRAEAVDAIVGGESLGLDVAEQLERLRPFGVGNPDVRLLVPSARVRDVQPMGEGRHARFSLESGRRRALGVAFGVNGDLSAGGGRPHDVAVRLEVNHWNGAVEPRVVLDGLHPVDTAGGEEGCAACPLRAIGEEWWRRLEAERQAALDQLEGSAPIGPAGPPGPPPPPGHRREVVDRRDGSPLACLAELVSTGEPTLALCADVSRRGSLAALVADPLRFGGGRTTLACGRCRGEELLSLAEKPLPDGGLLLADWAALGHQPALPFGFEHVVLVDPPPSLGLEVHAARGRAVASEGPVAEPPWGTGYLHLAWGEAEVEFALAVLEVEWPQRATIAGLYRALADAGGEPRGDDLLAILAGRGRHPRTPEQAGRTVRVLEELGLVRWEGTGGASLLRVVSSEATDLERSGAFRVYRGRYEDGRRFLSSRRQPR